MAGIGEYQFVFGGAEVEDVHNFLMAEAVVDAVVVHRQEGSGQAVAGIVEDDDVVGIGIGVELPHGLFDFAGRGIVVYEQGDLVVAQCTAFGAFQEAVKAIGIVIGEFEGGHIAVRGHAHDDGKDAHIAVIIYRAGPVGAVAEEAGGAAGRSGLIAGFVCGSGRRSLQNSIDPVATFNSAVGVAHAAFAIGHVLKPGSLIAATVRIENAALPFGDAVVESAHVISAVAVSVAAIALIAGHEIAVALAKAEEAFVGNEGSVLTDGAAVSPFAFVDEAVAVFVFAVSVLFVFLPFAGEGGAVGIVKSPFAIEEAAGKFAFIPAS